MDSGELKIRLRSGGRLFGTLLVSPSPRWLDPIRKLGLDFVFIDTEHIALDRAQLSWMCQAYRSLGLPAIVRVPEPNPYLACMAFDGGASGVIFPYVETVAEAQALRGAACFRPLKGARLDAALRDPATLEPELRTKLEERNRDSLFIINIESVPAMRRLDELLAVPGLDAVLIGPHDLSHSLGLPERYDDPRFEAAVCTIVRQARAAGVGAGIHWWGPLDRFGPWMEAGLNLVICSADITAMQAKLAADLATLRRQAGHANSSGEKAGAI